MPLAYGVVVGRLPIAVIYPQPQINRSDNLTQSCPTGGSPILKPTAAPHISKAGSALFRIAINVFFRKSAGSSTQDARSPGCQLQKEVTMDTTLMLPWEYLAEQTAAPETFAHFEALDFAGVLTGCIADVGFAATDRHRWTVRQRLHATAPTIAGLFSDSIPYRNLGDAGDREGTVSQRTVPSHA
jgi:hypothetical protein